MVYIDAELFQNAIFSPSGRLFQVEYAFQTLNQGTSIISIKGKDGIVLINSKKPLSLLRDKVAPVLRKLSG